jgi:hypothetical protein
MHFFRLTRFLSLLTGTTTITDGLANCADLAAAVAVFANLLGCRLELAQLTGTNGNFPLNAVRVFGLDQIASGPHTTNGFDFHRTAAVNSQADRVLYDACLQLDSCGNPAAAPFCWSPSVAVPLRSTGGTSYLDRLVAPEAHASVDVTGVALPTVKRSQDFVTDPFIHQRFDSYRALLFAMVPFTDFIESISLGDRAGLVLVDELPWESDTYGELPGRRYLAADPQQPQMAVTFQEITCTGMPQAVDVAGECLASASGRFTAGQPVRSALILSDPSGNEAVLISPERVVLVSSIGVEAVDAAAFARGALGL